MNSPYISTGTDVEGRPVVRVDDSALFDFVEEHLVELHGFERVVVQTPESEGATANSSMTFEPGTLPLIDAALSLLDEAQVLDIYNLNNPLNDE